jgi:hypothetical protein
MRPTRTGVANFANVNFYKIQEDPNDLELLQDVGN